MFKKPSMNTSLDLALEPRVMFDAAMAVDIVDGLDVDHSDEILNEFRDMAPEVASEDTINSVYVIDFRIENADLLRESLPVDAQILMLDNQSDGFRQISSFLETTGPVSSLHVFSHGEQGVLYLGQGESSVETMLGDQAETLSELSLQLTQDADILIYGCDFAAGDKGQMAVVTLSALTAADVAASDDATGRSNTGGDWDLEVALGDIDTRSVSIQGFEGLLAVDASSDILTIQDSEDAANGTISLTVTNNESTVLPRVVETMHNAVWTFQESSDVGKSSFVFDISALGLAGTKASDFAIVISSDGNFADETTTTVLRASGFDALNGLVYFHGVNANDGDIVGLATQTKAADNILIANDTIVIDEDNQVDLGVTFHPTLTEGGSLPAVVSTEAGYLNPYTTTPLTYKIPAGTTAITLTSYSTYAGSENDVHDDFRQMTATIDLGSGTSSGFMNKLTDGRMPYNAVYSWNGVENGNQVGSDSSKVTNLAGTNYASANPTFAVVDGELQILDVNGYQTAYHIEFLSSDTASADFIGAEAVTLNRTEQTEVILDIPENANYVKIIQYDAVGGNQVGSISQNTYDVEYKGLSVHYVDLDTFIASGASMNGYGIGPDNVATFSYSDHNVDAGQSPDAITHSALGDTTASRGGVNGLTISTDGNQITVSRDATFANKYETMFSFEFYDRKDVGSPAEILGSSSDTAVFNVAPTDPKAVLEFVIPEGSKFGVLNLSMSQANPTSNTKFAYNENVGLGYITFDLETLTTSGNLFNMRNVSPDFMSWEGVGIGTDGMEGNTLWEVASGTVAGDGTATTNNAAYTHFTDRFIANTRFDITTNGAGDTVVTLTTYSDFGSSVSSKEANKTKYDYYTLANVDWYGTAPVKLYGTPPGGSFDGDVGYFDEAAGAFIVDLKKAAISGLKYTPPEHYSGIDDVRLTISFGPEQDEVRVIQLPVLDEITFDTTAVTDLEGASVAIGSLVSPTLIDLDGSEAITSTVLSGLTVGHTISDGTNSFTATDMSSSVDLEGWDISKLTYFGGEDANGTYTFDVTVTHVDDLAKSLDQATIDALDTDIQNSLIKTDVHTQTMSVTLMPQNDVPVANNDGFSVISGGTYIIQASTLLINDTDIDGDTLSVTIAPVSGPTHGSLIDNGDGTFTYQNDGLGAQTDSFTYRISDENGGTAEATVAIDIFFAPDSADKTITINEDTEYTLVLNDFAFTDADSGDVLTEIEISTPTAGNLFIDGVAVVTSSITVTPADLTSGRLVYKPAENENGVAYAVLEFVVSDGNLNDPTPNTLTINVTPVNDLITVTGEEIVVPNITDGQTGISIATSGAFVDPDNEIATYTATGLPEGLVIDPTTGEITSIASGVASSASQGGPYTVSVTAISIDGSEITKTITIGVSNPVPTATQIEDQSGKDGEPVEIDIASLGNFSDEDALSYTATGLPAGLSIDPSTGKITGTIDTSASQDGPFTVVITATDADGASVEVEFTYSVENPAPTTIGIPAQSAVDGETVQLDVVTLGGFEDEDDLSYSMTGLPEGFIIDPTTGLITGTFSGSASQSGPYTVLVTATDKDGKTVTTEFTYSVANPAPEAIVPLTQSVVDGQTVRVPLSEIFTDPDGDALEVSITDLPAALGAGVIVTENGISYLELTVDNSASQTNGGSYSIALQAKDADGAIVDNTVMIAVSNPAPEDHELIEVNAKDGDVLSFALVDLFTDPDGDDLTYSITSAPEGLGGVQIVMIDGKPTISVDVATSASQINGGLHEVTIEVSDGEGGTAEVTYQLKIANPVPTTIGLPDQTAVEGETISLAVANLGEFSDEDDLSYSMTGLPEGFVIDPTTGVITGTFSSTAANQGPYVVEVTATDADGNIVTTSFEFGVTNIAPTVTEAEIEVPPLVDGQNVSIETALGFTDGDGDTLTFTAAGLPDGLSIDPNTGQISGKLGSGASQDGPYTVVITAIDENGESVSREITLNVANTEITAIDLPDVKERIGVPITDIDLDIFEDQDGDDLDITVKGLPSGVEFDANAMRITGTPDGTVIPGDYTITVIATDNEGSKKVVTFIMTIPEVPTAGLITQSPLSNVYAGQTVDNVFTSRPSDILANVEIEQVAEKVLLDSLDSLMSTASFSTQDSKHSTLQVVEDISELQRHLDKVVTPDYVQVIHISVSEDLQGEGKPLSSAQVMVGDSRILYYLNANEGVTATFSADEYLGGVTVSKAGAIVLEKWVDQPFEVIMEIKGEDGVEYITIEIDPRLHNAEVIAAETRASLLTERLDWVPALY